MMNKEKINDEVIRIQSSLTELWSKLDDCIAALNELRKALAKEE